MWSIADPVGREGWSHARVERIERLLPHVRQFVQVREALVRAKTRAASLEKLLDHAGAGVIELDRRARVMAANDRARAIVHAGTGLTDRDGKLHALVPADDATLQGLLVRALPTLGGSGAGGSTTVRREGSSSRFVVHVSPVRNDGTEEHEAEVGALVLVVDPMDAHAFDPERVREALKITRAESQVAVLLARGKSIDDVAAAMGRRPATVKWHIRNIYDKLGLKRRAELAGLVVSLAGVSEARGGAGPVGT